jgi:hypothetical protein
VGEAGVLAGVALREFPAKAFQGVLQSALLSLVGGAVLLGCGGGGISGFEQQGVEGGLAAPEEPEEAQGGGLRSEEPRRVRHRRGDVLLGAPERRANLFQRLRFGRWGGGRGLAGSGLLDRCPDFSRELVRQVVGSRAHESRIIRQESGRGGEPHGTALAIESEAGLRPLDSRRSP